jgi:hypothetical protein|tara:strand:+ start:524 stop:958 length:435 start_codon:yes stop_codon:yes gene_type:complete
MVLYCGVVRSDSAITTDASEVVLLVARIEQSLLLGLEIPESALTSDDPAIGDVANQLRSANQLFTLPSSAQCKSIETEITVEATASRGQGRRLSAGWEYQCLFPGNVNGIGIGLFSIIDVGAIRAILFPDGQHVITEDKPFLPL